jgi:serine/threonine protein kinase
MIQEIIIHRSLNHRHIVGFHGSFDDSYNVYIILELCRKRVSYKLLLYYYYYYNNIITSTMRLLKIKIINNCK